MRSSQSHRCFSGEAHKCTRQTQTRGCEMTGCESVTFCSLITAPVHTHTHTHTHTHRHTHTKIQTNLAGGRHTESLPNTLTRALISSESVSGRASPQSPSPISTQESQQTMKGLDYCFH